MVAVPPVEISQYPAQPGFASSSRVPLPPPVAPAGHHVVIAPDERGQHFATAANAPAISERHLLATRRNWLTSKHFPLFVISVPLVGIVAVAAAIIVMNAREDAPRAAGRTQEQAHIAPTTLPQSTSSRPAGITSVFFPNGQPTKSQPSPIQSLGIQEKTAQSAIAPPATIVKVNTAPIATFNDPAFQQWMKSVAALPAEQQVQAVSKKLMDLNPGFDGKEDHKIENGVVTELRFGTENVRDIFPVRVLAGLKSLTCAGIGWDNKGALSDLTPLKQIPLAFFDCHYNPVSD